MDDQSMTDLLQDAVAYVEPADRLAELRARTSEPPSRRGWWVAGGAVLATAAAVAVVAAVGNRPEPRGAEPATPPPASIHVVAVYYLGTTPEGQRLYREWHERTGVATLDEAVSELSTAPEDPDYTTYWAPGELLGARVRDGVIQVDVDPSVTGSVDGVPCCAELGLQQLVYTLQGAAGQRLPVQLVDDGQPVTEIFGQQVRKPLTAAPELDVLSLVNISDPTEGRVVSGLFTARGVAASFEGTVPWQLLDQSGAVVAHGSAQGEMADHLTPWQTKVDVSGLAPGRYTFVAMTDDQSNDQSNDQGPGPFQDTRTVVVQ